MIDLTWIEKYVTFEQSAEGELHVTDHHFLAEICYRQLEQIDGLQAALYAANRDDPLATFGLRDPRAFTNGFHYTRKSKSYSALDTLDRDHPPDQAYWWEVSHEQGSVRLPPIHIGGKEGTNQIPGPSPIFVHQHGESADPAALDARSAMTLSWLPFETGCAHPGSDWNDLIFVLISDAGGNVVFTGGAPGGETDYLDYTNTQVEVPAGLLEPGSDYVFFMSQVKYVDNNRANGVQQLACNSFAVELPVRTAGPQSSYAGIRRKADYLWAGKTPSDQGLVPWPAFARN